MFIDRRQIYARIACKTTRSACGLFTKHPEKIQKYRQTCNLKHLSQNELDKACLAHDLSYSDSKDLAERTILDKTFDTKTGLGWSVNEQPPEELT